MKITAKVIAHSIARHRGEIVTFELCYPRPIHGEVLTHRDFSRNAMSSRAIPVARMIEQVRNSPWIPAHWGKNQKGMQAGEDLSPELQDVARAIWLRAAEQAAANAEDLAAIGLHKQIANRVLEPFQWMRTIVTTTKTSNFYELRMHKDAEPHFQDLAYAMAEAHANSTPVLRFGPTHDEHSWHLPYILEVERDHLRVPDLLKASGARCARVSYLTHDNESPSLTKDIGLYESLVVSRPRHASPVEHQATPAMQAMFRSRNFNGWIQHREVVEGDVALELEATHA